MKKILINYLFKTTSPDHHAEFKKRAENEGFCEFVLGYRKLPQDGFAKAFCPLPNTSLWTVSGSTDDVVSKLEKIANEILDEMLQKEQITRIQYSLIKRQGGLIEDINASYLLTEGKKEIEGYNVIMRIKNKNDNEYYFVTKSINLDECLNHQKKIKGS